MSGYFRPNIGAMTGYVPGEQPFDGGTIKLNTNENPYPPRLTFFGPKKGD
jgi:histidinol-phosphate aminotransferase